MTGSVPEIVAFPESEVPRTLRLQVLALQDQAWPAEGSRVVTDDDDPGLVHDPALHPVSMLVVKDGRVLAALDILTKTIVHGAERYRVSGLSTVVTDRRERGKGYGRALVEAARERIHGSGVDLGLFTCDTPLQGFYERSGWTVLPGTALVGGTPQDPFPSDRFDKVTMAAFFSPRARRAADGFAHSRIELYPGEIDRLW
jgi:GNAT superfamily N-acetyltransferase